MSDNTGNNINLGIGINVEKAGETANKLNLITTSLEKYTKAIFKAGGNSNIPGVNRMMQGVEKAGNIINTAQNFNNDNISPGQKYNIVSGLTHAHEGLMNAETAKEARLHASRFNRIITTEGLTRAQQRDIKHAYNLEGKNYNPVMVDRQGTGNTKVNRIKSMIYHGYDESSTSIKSNGYKANAHAFLKDKLDKKLADIITKDISTQSTSSQQTSTPQSKVVTGKPSASNQSTPQQGNTSSSTPPANTNTGNSDGLDYNPDHPSNTRPTLKNAKKPGWLSRKITTGNKAGGLGGEQIFAMSVATHLLNNNLTKSVLQKKALLKNVIGKYGDFENSAVITSNIFGLKQSGQRPLEDYVLNKSLKYSFSPTTAMGVLGRAGQANMTLRQSMAVLDPILKYTEISGGQTSLERTGELVGMLKNKVGVAPKDMEQALSQIYKATNISSLSMGSMNEFLRGTGTASSRLDLDVPELMALGGVLRNAGMQPAQAGQAIYGLSNIVPKMGRFENKMGWKKLFREEGVKGVAKRIGIKDLNKIKTGSGLHDFFTTGEDGKATPLPISDVIMNLVKRYAWDEKANKGEGGFLSKKEYITTLSANISQGQTEQFLQNVIQGMQEKQYTLNDRDEWVGKDGKKGNYLNIIATTVKKLEKSTNTLAEALGRTRDTWNNMSDRFSSSIEAFSISAGRAFKPTAGYWINQATSTVNSLSGYAQANPNATSFFMKDTAKKVVGGMVGMKVLNTGAQGLMGLAMLKNLYEADTPEGKETFNRHATIGTSLYGIIGSGIAGNNLKGYMEAKYLDEGNTKEASSTKGNLWGAGLTTATMALTGLAIHNKAFGLASLIPTVAQYAPQVIQGAELAWTNWREGYTGLKRGKNADAYEANIETYRKKLATLQNLAKPTPKTGWTKDFWGSFAKGWSHGSTFGATTGGLIGATITAPAGGLGAIPAGAIGYVTGGAIGGLSYGFNNMYQTRDTGADVTQSDINRFKALVQQKKATPTKTLTDLLFVSSNGTRTEGLWKLINTYDDMKMEELKLEDIVEESKKTLEAEQDAFDKDKYTKFANFNDIPLKEGMTTEEILAEIKKWRKGGNAITINQTFNGADVGLVRRTAYETAQVVVDKLKLAKQVSYAYQ